MKKAAPYRIESISGLHRLFGLPKPHHPLISVIDFELLKFDTNKIWSSFFYCFGDNPRDIPGHLSGIIKQGQGHRSQSNGHYFNELVHWITSIGYAKNRIHSEPKDRSFFTSEKGYLGHCTQYAKNTMTLMKY
ncbi:hypothetical protein J2X69_000341 [Algoriphagus sp. 4150]|uniref:hypothetical protein n=1 Tax=Algoriphagus sp. 4150 TaxID=2817756 RepID=UPI002854C869|nr:hypothetical protein [Algoriphagus sp. 4150]MDR7128013.1 hypothetical protein [Algoriphagus sp. 4150]